MWVKAGGRAASLSNGGEGAGASRRPRAPGDAPFEYNAAIAQGRLRARMHNPHPFI